MNNKEKTTMDKIFGLVKYIIGALVIIVIMTNVGRIVKWIGLEEPVFENSKVVVRENYDLDQETLAALETAEQAAYQYASGEIDKWIGDIRVNEERFLDEYFSYARMKGRDLAAFYYGTLHKVLKVTKTPAEILMEDLKKGISNHFFSKEVAQMKVTNITNGAVEVFIKTFDNELIKLQEKHNIPKPVWDKYIYNLCSMIARFESKSVPTATKIVVGSLTGISIKAAQPLLAKLGPKVAQKIALKTGAKSASLAGAKRFSKWIPGLGTVITIAVIGWDYIDYKLTADRAKSDPRDGFDQYFQEMKTELLGPTEDSIMGSIGMWSDNLKKNISNNK